MKNIPLTTALVLLMGPGPALSQEPESIKQAVDTQAPLTTGLLGGDLSFGMIDGDLFATLHLGLSMNFDSFGFGVRVPLRFRLKDVEPENREVGGALRKEDWDEFTDYLKIIRYFRYGNKGDTLHFILGELPGASLGHGTVVNRYYNNIDLDHYKMGFALDVNTDYGGVESVFNNAFLSNLIGARAYIRPWSFVDVESYLNNLAVGFTLASDYSAPYQLEPGVVEDGYPKVINDKAATVLGADIEFRVLDSSWLTLIPYMDLNTFMNAGMGYHVGALAMFHIPMLSLDLQTRLEYRYFQTDYIPAYFNSYYEIQKFGYPFRDEQGIFGPPGQEVTDQPKRRVIEEISGEALNGYYVELVFSLHELVHLGASYDDYDGPYNSNLRIYLEVPALSIFQLGAYYYRHSFEGADQAFKFDEKSLFLAEGRYQLNSFLYILAQYWRIWQMNPESGLYEPVDDWSVGLGMSYSF